VKVLAITNMYPSPDRPWVGTFVEQQVQGLQAIGVEVKVLYFDRKQEGPLIYYRMQSRIEKSMAEFQPDLVHVMYGGVMADQIARMRGLPSVVVTFHGSDLLGENLSGIFRKIVSHYGVHCSRRAARRASGVIVVARDLLKALPASLHLPSANSQLPSNVRVIPCGIDLDRFKPMDQEACRQKLGWAPGTFHILFPANAGDPVKRPWLAQAALQALKEQGGKTELHLLSGVPYRDVPLWVNASDVLILTSIHEGSPTVVKEALSCNVPVVSVDVGDVAERLQGIAGCHLAAPEPQDLALKLHHVWQRKARVDSRTSIQPLSTEAVAKRLQGFYHEVLGVTPGHFAPDHLKVGT